MTRVLVSGGAGFIGSNLTDRLLADGHEVTVVDDLSTGKMHNLDDARRDHGDALTVATVDITTPDVDDVVAQARPEAVLHLAAQIDVRYSVQDPVHDAMVNVVGTVRLLEASRRAGVSKFAMTSSGGTIYGEPDAEQLPIDETFPGHPGSPYGASKRGVEEYFHTYQALYGLRWTSLALGNVFGPRQDPHGEAGVVSIFGGRMLRGEPIKVFGDGKQTRDFVYVGDVVDALVASLDRGDNVRVNVGTARQTSVNELVAVLAELTGYDGTPAYAPERPGELRNTALDWGLAASELGWKPATSLRDGLAATVEWLRD